MCKLHKNFYNLLIVIVLLSCNKKKDTREFKVFKYNEAEALTSLDPAFARNQSNIWACTHLYNSLIELNQWMEITPSLAEKWIISPDGKTYTFYLRKGVKFHDNEVFPDGKGRELTADDVVYSFKRIIDSSVASPGAWVFNDKVLRDASGRISDTCFKAIDKYTFRINLSSTFPPFLQMLAMPYAFVVAREAAEKYGKEYRMHPVGTGPFQFKMWEEGNALLLTKNPDYWKFDEGGTRLPYLDVVHISFINDRNIVFYSFLQGKIDFIGGLDENSRDVIFNYDGSIKKEFSDKYDVQKVPYLNTEYLGFQLDEANHSNKKNPVLNKKVRQALNYGMNRDQMVKFLLNNVGIPGTHGFIPPFLMTNAEAVKGYNYDMHKARQLLNEAGYPQGKGLAAIKLYTIARFPYKEIAEFLQREWAKLGIKVKIEINTVPNLLEMVSKGHVEFFRASWLGDYPDAENYLTLFYSKNFSPGGANKTHFKSEVFDKLYEKALTEQNDINRLELYRQMDQLVTDEAPVIVLFYDQVVRMTQKKVFGLKANPMNSLVLEKVDIVKQ